MSISYQIPTSSRYIPTNTVFSAVFNDNPAQPGKYDFTYTGAGNADIEVLELQPGTIYLIERISTGGNISEYQFLQSIATFCQVSIKYKQKKSMVYQFPVPVNNYFDGQEAACWISSDKGGDSLLLTFEGLLNQTPAMIGLQVAKIAVGLNIFAVDSAYFNGSFRDELGRTIGQINRR